jgi:hypothetical protein
LLNFNEIVRAPVTSCEGTTDKPAPDRVSFRRDGVALLAAAIKAFSVVPVPVFLAAFVGRWPLASDAIIADLELLGIALAGCVAATLLIGLPALLLLRRAGWESGAAYAAAGVFGGYIVGFRFGGGLLEPARLATTIVFATTGAFAATTFWLIVRPRRFAQRTVNR